MAFFSKKQKQVDTSSHLEDGVKQDNQVLISEHKKIKNDIEYLENQYTPYFLKSLIQDFEEYKNRINNKDVSPSLCWKMTNSDNKSCTFEKTPLGKTASWHDKLELSISHNGEINEKFILESIRATSKGNSVRLNASQFKDIVFRYILTISVLKSKNRFEETKESFNFMLKVIGTETHRDVKIDEILK